MKQTYIKPSIKTRTLDTEDNLLYAASIAVGGDADTNTKVDARSRGGFWNDADESETSQIIWNDDE